MHEIAKAILSLGETNSRNDKIAILKNNENNTVFKEVLRFVNNPYVRTGIAAAKLSKDLGDLPNVPPITVLEAIDYFTKHQTGADADVLFAKTFIAQQKTPEAKKLAIAIVTKNLKIGVAVTTLNSVYGEDFIPKIGIMRGSRYFDVKDKVDGPFIVTEKLDGARRLIVKENGNVTLYSRNGHVDEGLVEIEAEAMWLPDNFVYDAELLADGVYSNSVELRQATNAIANSKGNRTGLTANIFDVIPIDEFKRGMSKHGALNRKTLLAAMFYDEASLERMHVGRPLDFINRFGIQGKLFRFIRPVPVLGIAYTEDDVMEFAERVWNNGGEGVMLNTVHGLYEISASPRRQLLKVKATNEYLLKCVGVFEGEGRLKGTLGGIILNYKGHMVRCGSGFNDSQRNYYWNNPAAIVGKYVEVDSFGESKNKSGGISLNCPIFKRIAGNVE